MTDRRPLPFALDIPFVQALGLQLWRFDSGVAEISLDVRPEMRNSTGGPELWASPLTRMTRSY